MTRKLVLAAYIISSALLVTSNVSAAEKIIEATPSIKWAPKVTNTVVGDVIVWRIADEEDPGLHGLRITNWAAVKDHVEEDLVPGQPSFFDLTKGENVAKTSERNKGLLRLRIISVPPAPAKITFNCMQHGSIMSGEVKVGQ